MNARQIGLQDAEQGIVAFVNRVSDLMVQEVVEGVQEPTRGRTGSWWTGSRRVRAGAQPAVYNVSRQSGRDSHDRLKSLQLQHLGDGESCMLGGDDGGPLCGSGHEGAAGDVVRAA